MYYSCGSRRPRPAVGCNHLGCLQSVLLPACSVWRGLRPDARHHAVWKCAGLLRVRPRGAVREVVRSSAPRPRPGCVTTLASATHQGSSIPAVVLQTNGRSSFVLRCHLVWLCGAAFQGLAFSLLDLVLTWLVFLYLRTGQLQRIGLVFFMHLIAACTVRLVSSRTPHVTWPCGVSSVGSKLSGLPCLPCPLLVW